MTGLTESLNICLARRLAMQYKESQQAAIIQTAARMLTRTDCKTTKAACLDLIAATPSERQRNVECTERMILA